MKRVKEYLKKSPYFLPAFVSCAVLSALSMILLILAQHNYPTGDDLGYSAVVRQSLVAGGSVFDAFFLAISNSIQTYFSWQGCYAATFLTSMQPGIWGDSFYPLTTWILLGTFLLSQLYFFHWFVHKVCKQRVSVGIFVWSSVACLQIYNMPYPNEAFYWYCGAMAYTFFNSIALIYLTMLGKLLLHRQGKSTKGKLKRILFIACSIFLGFFIGGGNFATGLCLCVLVFCLLAFCIWRKISIRLVLPAMIVLWIGFLLNIIAPGNTIRQSSVPEDLSLPALEAVWLSIRHMAASIRVYCNIQVYILAACLAPILWKGARKVKWDFRYPLLFVGLAFGVYASMLAPISYANGSYGPQRMSCIIWANFFYWLLFTEFYLIGWLAKKGERVKIHHNALLHRLANTLQKPITTPLFTLLCGCLFLLSTIVIGYKDTTAYQAYRSWRIGDAVAYGLEMEERLTVLEDDSITDVYFHPIVNRPLLLFYCDITDDPQDYFNTSMAQFYGKKAVNLIR
ncbi:MAG: DUF6056 family protein [Lachnospiraceae bacterium]|jgi:hypothetical protein|nr:DUF6056 family protein [Lachnospiraceae bacterium]